MTHSEQVHAVLLNWNQYQDTRESIESLLKQKGVSIHFTLVDNGSVDDSVQRLRETFPWLEIIENGKNLGFAPGNNVGIRHVLDLGAQNILLINNDIDADPDMLKHMVEHLKSGVGIVCPAIYYFNNPDTIWSAGGKFNPLLLEMITSQRSSGFLTQEVIERDFMPSCAWLVQRDVFETVGLLDERFFLYYDDLDYCLRLRKMGYKILLVPQARLWHKVSQSSGGENKPRERYFMGLSSGLYFRKHMRFWQVPFILPFRLVSALSWTFRLSRKKNMAGIRSYWKGLSKGWLGT
jgi:GT2 family glycosyltransferase